jgi:hypothetical protein
MLYLEFLRIRQRVVIILGLLAALVVLTLVSAGHAHVDVNGSHAEVGKVPLAALIFVAGFVAAAFGAFLGSSLNSLGESLPSLWTKPVPRVRMAISIIAFDLLAMLVVWAGTLTLELVTVAGLGLSGHLVVDPMVSAAVELGLGTALMCYGNAQAFTAWHQAKGGMVAGCAWGSYFVLVILALVPLSSVLHGIVMALNVLNPLAYYGISSSQHDGDFSSRALFTLDASAKVAIVFALGIAGCAIGAFGWKRMEI